MSATFTAATWNVNHASTGSSLVQPIKRFKGLGVDVYLLQEVKKAKGAVRAFKVAGLGIVHAEPEFAVAWNQERFEYVRHREVILSDENYWKTENRALIVVLRDRLTGRLVKCMSYHTPAHVQAPRHVTFPKVSKVVREAAATWRRIARHSRPVCLFGGDDNIDELRGWSPVGGWDFMLNGPLEQVRAPAGTHGPRKIDDFRVRDLKPVGRGSVHETGSDHRAHVRQFRYDN
jgi:hypothetical protein